MPPSDHPGVSRRAVLRATGGAVGLSLVGTATADGDDGPTRPCEESTRAPNMEPCAGTNEAGCADDHPATVGVQRAVRRSLTEEYPDVGTLIERGFLPYFDVARAGDDSGYSHWLSPEFVGDDGTLDPARPESVLVDNRWWRPIGVMFVATDRGDAIDEPPAVYGDDAGVEGRCSPWHHHTGLPGRFAWWFYRTVYEGDPVNANIEVSLDDRGGLSVSRTGSLDLPCVTPCMMHVWAYPNPDGVYAHGPPPVGNRGGPPAERAGFDTDAAPGEDELGWDALPDEVVARARPGGVRGSDGDGWLPGWLGG